MYREYSDDYRLKMTQYLHGMKSITEEEYRTIHRQQRDIADILAPKWKPVWPVFMLYSRIDEAQWVRNISDALVERGGGSPTNSGQSHDHSNPRAPPRRAATIG